LRKTPFVLLERENIVLYLYYYEVNSRTHTHTQREWRKN